MLKIEIASNFEEILGAWTVVYEQYLSIAAIPPNPFKIWTFPHYTKGRSITVTGSEHGRVVCTGSAVLDSPDKLPLDNYFGKELDRLRRDGRKLIEIGLLADQRDGAKLGLSLMLQAALASFGLHMKHYDFVIGIHPKSIHFYTTHYGFNVLGDKRDYSLLGNTPVTLLHASMKANNQFSQQLMPVFEQILSAYNMDKRYKFPIEEFAGSFIMEFLNNYYENERTQIYHPETERIGAVAKQEQGIPQGSH